MLESYYRVSTVWDNHVPGISPLEEPLLLFRLERLCFWHLRSECIGTILPNCDGPGVGLGQ